jgi:hypothetical protein
VLYLVLFDTSLEIESVTVYSKLKVDDKELYVPDDVLERVTKCCLKNQNYVIRKNWKNLRANENQ